MAERVNVDIEESVAKTAYGMALDLWRASNPKDPNMTNKALFMHLVADCAHALQGKKAYLPKIEAE